MAIVTIAGNDELVPMRSPAWYETEKAARISGIALITLGVIGSLVCTGVVVASVVGVIGVSCIGISLGVIGAIIAIAAGVGLTRKDNWNDPQWVARVAEAAKNLELDQIVQKWGWEHTSKHHFISCNKLTEKLLTKIERERLTYSQVADFYHKQLKDHTFHNILLRPLLMKEVEDNELNVKTFKIRFGIQPITDGVISINDPWIQDSLLLEVQGKNFNTLKRDYEGIISDDQMRNELIGQLQVMGFDLFYRENRDGFYTLITEGIFTPFLLTDFALVAVVNKSIEEILDAYGWPLFTYSILKGNDYRQAFEQEVQDAPLSRIIARYSLKVVECGMAAKEFLRGRLDNIEGWSFDRIIDTFTWEALDRQILLGVDVHIPYLEKARRHSFCQFWEHNRHLIQKYGLFTPEIMLFAIDLGSRMEQAKGLHRQNITQLERECRQKKEEAKNVRDAQRSRADAIVRDAANQIRDEVDRSNLFNAQNISMTIYSDADRQYNRSCQEADNHFVLMKREAETALNFTLQGFDFLFQSNTSGVPLEEVEVKQVERWVTQNEQANLCQEQIRKFIGQLDRYLPLLLNSLPLLEYMANQQTEIVQPVAERFLANRLSTDQKAALIPLMRPSDIRRFINGITAQEASEWLEKTFFYDRQNRLPLDTVRLAYEQIPRSLENRDYFLLEMADNLFPKIHNGALALIAKRNPEWILPFIPVMQDRQLASILPQLENRQLLTILRQLNAINRQIYVIKRTLLEVKKSFIALLPPNLENVRKAVEEAQDILRSSDSNQRAQRIAMLNSRKASLKLDEEQMKKLLKAFESGDFDGELNAILERKGQEKAAFEQQLEGLFEQLAHLEGESTPDRFCDPLTGEVMTDPIMLPPYQAGNRVDKKTFENNRFFPRERRNGVVFIKNPFTTTFHPVEDYIPDLQLQSEIQAYRRSHPEN